MRKQYTSRTKLLVPIFILITILMFLAIFIISTYYSKINILNNLNNKIELSTHISNLVHSLQKERGLSSGYATNKDEQFQQKLLIQRKKTDKISKILLNKIDDLKCKEFKKSIDDLKQQISKLKNIRASIDKGDYSPEDVIYEYSYTNSLLLDMIVSIAKRNSYVPAITQDLLAYSNFLYLKEYTGLQRAQGVVFLSFKKFNKEVFTEFVNLMAVQQQNEMMFLKYATKDLQKYYIEQVKDNSFKQVWIMERIMITKNHGNYNFDAEKWYQLMTEKLNIFDKISKYIEKQTQKKITDELNNSINFFIIVIILLLGSWLLFIDIIFNLLKLLKNEQRLRIVMDKYIISSITDLKGKIIDVSQAFCEISGYTKSELLGKNHNILRHKDMSKEAFKELWDKITTGKSWHGKIKNRKKDGNFYWVIANVEPLYNEKGNVDAYISIRMDITENELLTQKIQDEEKRNKIQEELMQQQHRLAQMGEMISMIAHQWRQPLSAITAASGAIMIKASRDKLEAQTAVELAQKIQEFSRHLSNTIDDFRNFFKSNKTKYKTDFKKICESVLSIIESSLERNKIEIIIQYDNVEEFSSYENELKQVILNLIKNSEDALKEKVTDNRKIAIMLKNKTLCISDNAGGIDEKILTKIFEPYFSTKTKKDGTGLGLYMSKIIVEEHCNGKLKVSNLGDGAMFEIILGDDND